MECYLSCLNASHQDVYLPADVPVMVGRMAEIGISDKVCSRSQVELIFKSHQKYVLVKRLGANPSQIDGIDIERNATSKLIPGQKLYIVNMKYPHCIKFVDTNGRASDGEQSHQEQHKKSSLSGRLDANQPKRSHKNKKMDIPTKKSKFIESSTRTKNNDSISDYSFKSDEDNQKIELSKDSMANKGISSSKPLSQNWSMGLKSAMLDETNQVFQDDQVIVIKDKYPKAKYHWLVLPKETIATANQLKAEHLPLLEHMLQVGKSIASKDVNDYAKKSPKFRYGYHAIASMSQLHMHVISQDFSSPCLKTKKHWNSFTTAYFVDATDIIEELKTKGKVKNRSACKTLLDSALRCHNCEKTQKNMPALKRHIESCR